MKFYIGGKWEEREGVRKLQNELRRLGHIITIDWTWHEEDDPGFPSQYAIEDIVGVTSCDAYVGRFVSKVNYRGALVEMGAALAGGKRVFIIGHAIDSCLFANHPLVQRFDNEAVFLRFIEVVQQK